MDVLFKMIVEPPGIQAFGTLLVRLVTGKVWREKKEQIYQLIRLDLENDDMLIHRLQNNN